jgi:basic membrane protein A
MCKTLYRRSVFAMALIIIFSLFASSCATASTPTPELTQVPKVALIMMGKAQDQSFNQYMVEGIQKMVDEGRIEASFAEDVTAADFERVAYDYASQNYDLIIGHTADFTEPALKVAKDFPEVHFVITGGTQSADNVAGFNDWMHQSAAVVGYLSALLSESKVVGIVGAFAFPTQFVAHEGFKYGVYSANKEFLNEDPDTQQVHCLETFTNSWTDAALGYEAAIAHMDQGADYIFATSSGIAFGVIQAAEKTKQASVIGIMVDMNSFGPDVVITSVERVAEAPLEAVLFDLEHGRFASDYSFDLTSGGTKESPYHGFEDKIPQDIKDKVAAFRQGIIDGRVLVPFVTARLGGETQCEVPTQ